MRRLAGATHEQRSGRAARWALALAALAILAGCESQPVRDIQNLFRQAFEHKGEPALQKGLREYEDGHYAQSARSLQQALEQGLSSKDRVKAHKYLAFIHCAAGREKLCRDQFRAALDIDPSMQLAPAEAGHPIWGPVFRSVKAGR